jgi:general stress protein 26
MAKKSMKSVAKLMADLDLCMFTTISGRGMTASRPMSNNSDVEYNGESFFFTWGKAKLAKDIEKNAHVNLTFTGSKRFQKIFISVSGNAKVIKDREKMRDHWNKDLEIWFDKGIDTPGIAMIQVKAKHIKYWHGREEGEVKVNSKS